jgi:hypothetical protein
MRKFSIVLAVGALFLSGTVGAQQPSVLHAQLSTLSAEGGLAGRIDALKKMGAATWVGYQVAVAKEFHSGPYASQTTFLEGTESVDRSGGGPSADARFDRVTILMRFAGGNLEKLRLENPDRQLDAGGLRFVWITGVNAGDSVHVLQGIAAGAGPEKVRQDAVFFISLHETREATPALVQLASSGDFGIRDKAAFWLANQRGHEGLVAIVRLAHEAQDVRFREKLAFDLTLSHEPAALDDLIRMAHEDASPQVRKQAQFWMANVGGRKMGADLRGMSERDPDAEVRKSAVFALSRLPEDEGTARLIQVAKTSKDVAVRRQAVFWLGQSKNPQALEYLTQLLRQ